MVLGMIKKACLLPFAILALLFGKLHWAAPPWLCGLYGLCRQYSKAFFSVVILSVCAITAYFYIDAMPKPVMVTAAFNPIQLTANRSTAKPSPLSIGFIYDPSVLNDDQQIPEGNPSVARIDLVGEEVPQGIRLSPAKKGQWRWVDDRRLQFVPETDWPPGVEYSVHFDKTIFSTATLLSKESYTFSTPDLTAEFSHIEFYQDPANVSVRKVVATLKFSHPIDKASLEKRLSMNMRILGKKRPGTLAQTPHKFTVSYDKNNREAYITSEAVTLPPQTGTMEVSLSKGVSSLLGGKKTTVDQERKTLIPDIYSFLKVSDARSSIVRNKRNEPEQFVMLEFTDDIDKDELFNKLSVYLLPKNGERNGKSYWKSPRQVSSKVLASSQKVTVTPIPNEKTFSKFYSFLVDVPENRYLYIKINKGLTSVNQFVHSSFYDTVLSSPTYPKEVDIAGDGSVLTYSGNHQLSVLTRGVSALKYSVGRLLDEQVYHLVSQTSGDISSPSFNNWNFNERNLSSFDSRIVDLQTAHPKVANYSSLDLTQYLLDDNSAVENQRRFGLFFVEVSGWNKRHRYEEGNAKDKRLILVTDLGVIVKNNADNSRDIFVQSIADGEPVEGAKVELLGKNGIAIFSGTTNSDGHISFTSTAGFTKEKTPTVYLIKTHNDLSFIPYERRSRQINLSKFDIGGVSSKHYDRDSLNAFAFTDRGIYRPGETVNLGMIVKIADMSNIAHIPLELVINGPRNKVVKVHKFTLPEKGFAEFQYKTESTSDTGRYSFTLHLIRDEKYRGRELGRVNFKVEEFQPDTLKIQSQLLDVVDNGWNTQTSIRSKVTLMNLFGTSAQNRKVSGRLMIQPHNFSFSPYKDYRFTDPYFDPDSRPLSLNKRLADQRTDADGYANFEFNLEQFREGTYQLRFIAEGYDQAGGRSVVASNSTLISPLETIVGYKSNGKLDYINAKSERLIEFIAIDKTLQKINSEALTLNVLEIKKISTLVKQRNGTYKYQTINKEVEVSSKDWRIDSKGSHYTIDTNTPGDFAIELIDTKGRRLSKVAYSVVGFANLTGKIDKNAELQLKLDKKDYYPGDTIEMSIKAPYSGTGLITIESDKVHRYRWFKADTESTLQFIQLPEDLEGTAYINVTFVRDVGSKDIFTSPLSYAVQAFSIDKSKRRVDIKLDTKEIVRPGKPMDIRFSTSKPAKIAVFAVDEGILQVARYKTPNPLSHFLKKRALDVETLQILDLILPDFDVVKNLSASGGDTSARKKRLGKNLNPFSRKTDKPAVFWSGIYDADVDTRTVVFNVPNTFAGKLRVMAVAVSETAVGANSTSATVRGPFVISPNVLTQAAPGDEFLVTVGVANIINGSGKQAPIDLEITASKHLTIMGEKSTRLLIDEGSEDKYTFRVKALPVLGAAELSFTARFKNEESSRDASLSVRPATPYYTDFSSGVEESGRVKLELQRQLYPDLAKQSLAASSSPLVIVDGLTAYLDTYPHGCTEQIVSKVFPLIGLLSHEAYAPHLPEVQVQFSYLIDKLRERQLGDGGFAFWPGHRNAFGYGTIYAMHFLLEASALGYPVPEDMLQRGQHYLQSLVERPAGSLADARDRANAIYILTRMGAVTTNYLVDLEESLIKNHKKYWKKDILSTYMAATYQLLQKQEEAKRLIAGYQLGSDKHQDLNDFHSLLAVDAQYIYLLSTHFQDKAKALDSDSIHQLTDKIFKGEYNTISSAYSILALGAYSQLVLAKDVNETINFTSTNNNKQAVALSAALQPFLTAHYDTQTTAVTLQGETPLYYLNVQSGFNRNLPSTTVAEGLEIYRDFIDSDGKKITAFEQGKEITVRLKVRALNNRKLKNVAVIDLLPGGFEVVRSSISRNAYNWQADYVDIREDRVIYYGNFDSSVRELSYKVKLTAAGDFVIPPSYAGSMYDRSIKAISKAGKFTVTASQ